MVSNEIFQMILWQKKRDHNKAVFIYKRETTLGLKERNAEPKYKLASNNELHRLCYYNETKNGRFFFISEFMFWALL